MGYCNSFQTGSLQKSTAEQDSRIATIVAIGRCTDNFPHLLVVDGEFERGDQHKVDCPDRIKSLRKHVS